MKRVLVTGATGFIGRHLLPALRERGFEVHAVGRAAPADPDAVFHPVDLLDPAAVARVTSAVEASHLVHLAWYAEPGVYWRSPRNLDWVAASLHLARSFAEAGGRRMVGAGTCAEYAWGADRLSEDKTPCVPATLYGAAKTGLFQVLRGYADVAGLSLCWGRIFYLYGPDEKTGRLVSDAARALLGGQPFETSHGLQKRDFLHVADVAGAFAALADGAATGAVNIASGEAVTVRSLLERIAAETGGGDLIRFGARALSPSEPAVVEADIRRLRGEVGFVPRFDLTRGVAETVGWWRGETGRPT